jgi:hypothetical protein
MQVLPCYIFAGAPALATHCHLPFGIFSQSVHPAFMGINRLTIAVRPFALPRIASDRRVPKRGHP